MYCNTCGCLVEDGSSFCASCGAPVAPVQNQPEVQQAFAPVTQPEQASEPQQSFTQPIQPVQPQQPYAQPVQPQQPYAQPAQPFTQQMPTQGYQQPFAQQPNPYQNAPYGMPGFSQNSVLLGDYLKEAKKLRTWGIVATVLMLGIGFIISIFNLVQAGKLNEPVLHNPTPAEIAELENAKKVLKTAKILSYIPFIALAISFLMGFIGGLTGTM